MASLTLLTRGAGAATKSPSLHSMIASFAMQSHVLSPAVTPRFTYSPFINEITLTQTVVSVHPLNAEHTPSAHRPALSSARRVSFAPRASSPAHSSAAHLHPSLLLDSTKPIQTASSANLGLGLGIKPTSKSTILPPPTTRRRTTIQFATPTISRERTSGVRARHPPSPYPSATMTRHLPEALAPSRPRPHCSPQMVAAAKAVFPPVVRRVGERLTKAVGLGPTNTTITTTTTIAAANNNNNNEWRSARRPPTPYPSAVAVSRLPEFLAPLRPKPLRSARIAAAVATLFQPVVRRETHERIVRVAGLGFDIVSDRRRALSGEGVGPTPSATTTQDVRVPRNHLAALRLGPIVDESAVSPLCL